MRTGGLAVLALASLAAAADPLPLVAIHDAPKGGKPGAVSFVDPESFAVLATVSVEGDPWPVAYDPSGAIYFVLGATPRSAWSGKVKDPWSVVAVDRAASKSTALGEIGLPPIATRVTPDRTRLYTLGRAGKGEPDVLGVFDLGTGKRLGLFPTGPGAVDWEPAADGRRLFVLHERKLIGLDTEALKLVAEVPLPPGGASVLAGGEGLRLYVLCAGGKAKEGADAQGKIVVVDALGGEVLARLDAGFEARSLRADARNGLVYALGEDAAGGLAFTVVDGTAVRGRVPVGLEWGGIRLGPGTDRVYVVGKGAVVEVDPAVPAVTRRWVLEFDPVNLIFDAERNRAFATPQLGLKVAELGLDDGKVHMSLTTGRTGTKVGKAIGLALLGTVERSGTAFTLGPEGRYLYVVNGQTDDLTIVDTVEHRVVDTVATGGGTRGILAPKGGASVYVVSKGHLTRFDTATRKAAGEISTDAEDGSPGAVTLAPDGRHLFVPRGKKVDVIDAAMGKRSHTIALPMPVSVVVSPEAGDGGPDPRPAPRETTDAPP